MSKNKHFAESLELGPMIFFASRQMYSNNGADVEAGKAMTLEEKVKGCFF